MPKYTLDERKITLQIAKTYKSGSNTRRKLKIHLSTCKKTGGLKNIIHFSKTHRKRIEKAKCERDVFCHAIIKRHVKTCLHRSERK